jgi:hyaluronoglucosaminidase
VTGVRWDASAPAWVVGWAGRLGLDAGDVALTFEIDPALPERRGPVAPGARTDDHHVAVERGADGSVRTVHVTGRTGDALRRSARTLELGLTGAGWPDDGAVVGPAFALRGLLEGYYGPPWSHAQRLRMVAEVADRGMTHLMVAPKDDTAQRREWWQPLGAQAADEVAELVSVARAERVRIACAVSPGLSIRWSSEESFAALMGRFQQLHDLGVRDASLLLDDIPDRLSDDEDRRRYPDAASAHADLAARWSRAMRKLDPDWRLSVCPLVYHGRGDEPYLVTLAAGLPPDVDLMWTGREICSRTLDLLDGATFWRATSRPPLWWDNYPVNDLAMRNRLHIGPLLGRDPHLHRVSAGLYANAMELAECTRIPLGTIADYLWDPEGYEPEESWQRSLRRVAGDSAALVAELGENVRTSCLPDSESPALTAVLEDSARLRRAGAVEEAAALLEAEAARIEATATALGSPVMANAELRAELAPWVAQYAAGAGDLRAAAAATRDAGAGDPDDLLGRRRVVGLHRAQVFGDVLDMFLTDLADDLTT